MARNLKKNTGGAPGGGGVHGGNIAPMLLDVFIHFFLLASSAVIPVEPYPIIIIWENILKSEKSAQRLFQGWRSSSEQKRNILSSLSKHS